MTCGASSAQTRDDARVNEEREEAQVMIACGFDVHRAQITFDLVDHETGELRRGRIRRATLERRRVWLAAVETARLVVAVEGTTGWRFVAEEVEAAGARVVLAEPGETRALRGPKRRAKTDRADARWLRELLERGELPTSWIPPAHLLELRCRGRLRQTLADERRAWLQRVHAELFHHGLPDGGLARGSAGCGPCWRRTDISRRRSRVAPATRFPPRPPSAFSYWRASPWALCFLPLRDHPRLLVVHVGRPTSLATG